MADHRIPPWHSIHTLVSDFDGVFTDNKVWTDQNGIESVSCDRGDGLAFELLHKFASLKNWKLSCFILSKESNPVVAARAKKLNIRCVQSASDKVAYLDKYLYENDLSADGLIYLGNDINDLPAVRLGCFSIAPFDAHPVVKSEVSLVLPQKGGDGFIRAVIDELIGINTMSVVDLCNFFMDGETSNGNICNC